MSVLSHWSIHDVSEQIVFIYIYQTFSYTVYTLENFVFFESWTELLLVRSSVASSFGCLESLSLYFW